jgi:hypothetical protein
LDPLLDDGARQLRGAFGTRNAPKGSGNAAFDAYKAETLQQLEAEQAEFAEYVSRLREARDRDELERFMAEHSASDRKV